MSRFLLIIERERKKTLRLRRIEQRHSCFTKAMKFHQTVSMYHSSSGGNIWQPPRTGGAARRAITYKVSRQNKLRYIKNNSIFITKYRHRKLMGNSSSCCNPGWRAISQNWRREAPVVHNTVNTIHVYCRCRFSKQVFPQRRKWNSRRAKLDNASSSSWSSDSRR